MRRIYLFVCIFALAACPLPAQIPEASSPQTARQALIEMFLGKGADDFRKHLPEQARSILIHKGETPETSWVLRIADVGRSLAQGGHVESFETGPNLLVIDEQDGHQKIEIAVEHDSLIGEADEIELSVHSYKDGQPESLPVVPRLTFTLQQEKETWRVMEVTAAAHIPLTDPDYLKSLRKEQQEANEAGVLGRLGVIGIAEKNYAAKHPDRGYTCSLASLLAPDPANPDAALPFYDPGQGNEEWNGYRFVISGCDGAPASKYRAVAAPIETDSEMKTFCADQSGVTKFVTEGKPSSCFGHGQQAGLPMGPGNVD